MKDLMSSSTLYGSLRTEILYFIIDTRMNPQMIRFWVIEQDLYGAMCDSDAWQGIQYEEDISVLTGTRTGTAPYLVS